MEDDNFLKEGIKELNNLLKREDEVLDTTINARYGVDIDAFNSQIYDILKDLEIMDGFSDVIDKHFKKLTANERLMVQAYAQAFKMHFIIKKYGGVQNR